MRESNAVRRAKKRARSMSSSDGITHQQALDAIAVESGHPHWSAMLAANPSGSKPTATEAPEGATRESMSLPGLPLPSSGDVFAAEWLHFASRWGETVQDHIVAAAAQVAPARRTRPQVVDLLSLCAMAVIESQGDGSLDGKAVCDEFERRLAEASARRRRIEDEAVAVKQFPSARVVPIMIEGLKKDTPVFGLEACTRLETAGARSGTMEADLIRDAAIAARRLGSPIVQMRLVVEGAGGIGAAGCVLARTEARCPLKDDEREMLTKAFAGSSANGTPTPSVVDTLAKASRGCADACALLRMLAPVSPSVVIALLNADTVTFPRAEGSMEDQFDAISHGIAMLSGRKDVFARWIVDAVSKARTGGKVFRYDPLQGARRRDAGGDSSLGLLASQMSILGSSPADGGGDSLRAFTSLAALAQLGSSNGTLMEICPGVASQEVRMTTLVDLHDSLIDMGRDQASLYAMVNGLSSEDEIGLDALFEQVTWSTVSRALSPFRHPAIAEAC